MGWKVSISSIICVGLFLRLSATTIIPFPNLYEMGMHSDAVVLAECVQNYTKTSNGITFYYSEFRLRQSIHGLVPTSFTIKKRQYSTPEYTHIILGDTDFEVGQRYLIFLEASIDETFKPRLMSYGVFREELINAEKFLVPLDYTEDVHLAPLSTGTIPDPLHIYRQEAFLQHLTLSLLNEVPYDHQAFIAPATWNAELRAAPSHCTYLFTDTFPHWPDFPTLPLPVWYHEDGVDNCANIVNTVQNALNDMHAEYPGIHLAIAGTHSFSPNCAEGSALDTQYVDWVRNILGGDRHLVIQFDDPCGEISNLIGCSGTLAIGGLLKVHTFHQEHGELWRDASIGTVLMNNNMGACYCGENYKTVLIHEMTHALGFNHIAGRNTANMNPAGFNDISNLDRQCVNYSYPNQENDCGSNESWNNLILYTDMTIRASQAIDISQLQLFNSATLTLIAPEVQIQTETSILNPGQLITIQEDQCN